jgi:hypothetical protein
MTALGLVFWKAFHRFINRLLSEQERQNAERVEAEMAAAPDPFGLATILSLVCLATAAVTGLQWLFLGGSGISLAICLIASAVGFALLYRRRSVQPASAAGAD